MKRLLAIVMLFGTGLVFVSGSHVDALSLKLAPLEYRTELKKGEVKKGFVDVSNPSGQTQRIRTSVQAFRQTDDNGSLQFFDSEQLSAGVKLDLETFDLGPREAVRMYFMIDGSKLPSGDVYGGIFFSTISPSDTAGVGQQVRLGTLLSIVNGTPGPRNGSVERLNIPPFVLGSKINGEYTFKNTDVGGTATGFYPKVRLEVSPFGEQKDQNGKLVFAGHSRTNQFEIRTPIFGVYKVSASYQASSKSSWVLVLHPGVMVVLGMAMLALTLYFHRKRTHR